MKVTSKKYLVAIAVPALDRFGRPLGEEVIQEWTKRALDELTQCFGGATPLEAWGENVLNGKVVYEKGQMLVLSGCDERADFLKHKARIESFADSMRTALNQESVFVLAFAPDSFLVEGESSDTS